MASWLAMTAVAGWSVNPELAFGMAAPLAGATVSWRAIERAHARAPERVTSVLIAGFFAKMVFFGLYVGLLGALWLRPRVLVVAFAAYFLLLHAIEAGYLRKLLAGPPAPVTP
ncbi:MAG TPA: hypothetical protein VGI12_13855 [Vicinamibacterales bacterium]